MNKSDFLKKLSKLLHMLQEEEVGDILSEYEQHIDMKVAEGMSEAEAIAAFGSVEELAGDILDAYHVKADFREKKKADVIEKVQSESKKVIKNAGEAGKGFWDKVSCKIKSAVTKCKDGLHKFLSACKKCCLAPFVFIKNWMDKKKEKSEAAEKPTKVKKQFHIGACLKAFFRGMIRLLKKLFYGSMLLFAGFTGVMLILFVGILVVLLFLGYPVIGVTIGTIGAAMAFNAVACFAGIKWRRV